MSTRSYAVRTTIAEATRTNLLVHVMTGYRKDEENYPPLVWVALYDKVAEYLKHGVTSPNMLYLPQALRAQVPHITENLTPEELALRDQFEALHQETLSLIYTGLTLRLLL